jgi:TolB protein
MAKKTTLNPATGLLMALTAAALVAGCVAPILVTPAPPQPTPVVLSRDSESQVLADLARDDLAAQLGVDADQIEVLSVEAVEFPNASLGVPQPGVTYAQVTTPGVVIKLGLEGTEYEYHGSGARVVAVPQEVEAAEGDVAIISVRVSEQTIRVMGTSTLAEGTCLQTELLSNDSTESWWPSSDCADVQDGEWQVSVALGQDGSPDGLDESVLYTVRAWQRGDPSVAAVFPFDLFGPPVMSEQVSYSSARYGVSLSYPGGWQPVPGYEERIGGEDGFFQLSALDGEGWTLEAACELEAAHELQPYGTEPSIEYLTGQGPGCLILPSADQPADMLGQAGLIVSYPRPREIDDETYHFFVLWADQQNIQTIVTTLRFDLPSGADGEEPALRWEGQDDDGRCQSLWLWAEGWAATGPCGGPAMPSAHFGAHQYLGLWPDWLDRFAPFEAETTSGTVALQGQGQEPPTEGWQRSLAAWARLAWMELRMGRTGASWGTALAGHWEAEEEPGMCRFLQVESYGYAYAGTARCEGGDAQDLGRGWLETAELEEFDRWYAGRAPLYRDDLDFFGMGSQAMSQEEAEALSGWAEALFARLVEEGGAKAAD